MSCNYADGLSPYHDKGQLGLEERFDSKSVVSAKVTLLTKWINEAKHVVLHTGAGISTSAGIPDFRGPRGVWTLQAKGEKPDLSTEFNDAIPTITHMAITKLVERGKIKYVVSQNIDGLHLRSNLQRKFLSELHGNMFTEQCNACGRQFVRSSAVPTVGQKSLNKPCPTLKANGRPCRGRLHDTILDWEHNLPENDLGMADYHSCLADLSICLGTTMQIVPSGNLPLYTKKHGGKLVICNLQPTKHNRKADLIIHAYVDEIMTILMKNLNLKIPKYSVKNDPTKLVALSPDKFFEWTISDYALKKMKKIYEEKCGTKEARKRLEMIDDDLPLSVAKNLKRTRGKEDDDSDLEVLDVIVKPKRNSVREPSRRTQKKTSAAAYSSTITMKKVVQPAKKGKYEAEKITIKKNVTPTKTKYEIVQPKTKKTPKYEIVYSTDSDLCNDLDMICESDDDEMTNNYTYNFRRYLYDEKDLKKEEEDKKKVEKVDIVESDDKNVAASLDAEVKNERKNDENEEAADEKNNIEKQDVKEDESQAANESKEIEIEKITEVQILGESTTGKTQESTFESATESDGAQNAGSVAASASSSSSPSEDDDAGGEKHFDSSKSKSDEKLNENDSRNESIERQSSNVFGNGDTDSSKTPEEELADYIKSAEMEAEKDSGLSRELTDAAVEENAADGEREEEASGKKFDSSSCSNSDSDGSRNSSNSAAEKGAAELVGQRETNQFENSLTASECSMNQTINENYDFYSNEYNSSGNAAEIDYVDNNYYNNF